MSCSGLHSWARHDGTTSGKLLAVITGPTAVGKTSLAIGVASHFGTEIISADSRQMYREMRIGTAVPSPEQLSAVPHHFIGNLSVTDYYNVSKFEVEALQLLSQLFREHDVVVVTGGSGLYLDALCRGVDDFPEVDQRVREQVLGLFQSEGIEGLRHRVAVADPIHFDQMDNRNKQRLMKVLEVCIQTGRPYSSFLTKSPQSRWFHIVHITLNTDRDLLYRNINQRVDQMVQDGLVEEARGLIDFKEYNALKTVGYRELFAYFEGTCSLEEALEKIKRNTRHYAKRQLTWFRKNKETIWLEPSQKDVVTDLIGTVLQSIKSGQR